MGDFGQMRFSKTRKDYRSEWCGELIPKGSRAWAYGGMWDNEWQNWHMRPECYEDYSLNCDPSEGFMPYDNERPKVTNGSRTDQTILGPGNDIARSN